LTNILLLIFKVPFQGFDEPHITRTPGGAPGFRGRRRRGTDSVEVSDGRIGIGIDGHCGGFGAAENRAPARLYHEDAAARH
jgi:hypothetical protein